MNPKQDYRLGFRPYFAREYGYNICITKGSTVSRLQSRASIIYAGEFMDNYNIFHLSMHDVYINQTEPDDHSYRLAQACSRAFYPLTIFCDRYGVVSGLRNDRIKQQWEKEKPLIIREFCGGSAERYIEKTEENIDDPQRITDIVTRNLFFHAFFMPQYAFIRGEEKAIEFALPLISFQDSLKGKGTQQYMVTNEDEKKIYHKGAIVDEQVFNYEQILRTRKDEGSGVIKGAIEIEYDMSSDSLIDAIIFEAKLTKESGEPLMDVKMEGYYLSEYPLQITEDKDTVLLGEKILREQEKQKQLEKREAFREKIRGLFK